MNPQTYLGTIPGGVRFPDSSRKLILLAEDSPDNRELMEMLLTAKGYQVISTESAHEAMKRAIHDLPDLILLDLQLPDLDGISVVRTLRRRPRLENVPMLILSGYDPSEYRDQALEAGCTDCLLKPLDFDELELILQDTFSSIKPSAN